MSEPFQPGLEQLEGHHDFNVMPSPVNPLQAQTQFERRAWLEDLVAHIIAIILTSGFFLLAFAALLGFVNISNAATATFLGTTMGYAVGQFSPILQRYFHARGASTQGATQPPKEEPKNV
jgi:hypothetical protein